MSEVVRDVIVIGGGISGKFFKWVNCIWFVLSTNGFDSFSIDVNLNIFQIKLFKD